MKILLSWSSGKDAAWVLHLLNASHPGAVGGLVTTVNERTDRVAMHGVRRGVLEAQARAAGLPLHIVSLPDPCPNELYEARMGDAFRNVAGEGFTHVAFGDLFLRDVRAYRERQLASFDLEPMFPAWNLPTAQLAADMLHGGLRARLACIDTRVLPESFSGREFDAALLEDLPAHVDPCGENGEFHTCVYAGPMFTAPLNIAIGQQHRAAPFLWMDLAVASHPIAPR